MDSVQTCKQCGQPLTGNTAAGLCTQCQGKVPQDTNPAGSRRFPAAIQVLFWLTLVPLVLTANAALHANRTEALLIILGWTALLAGVLHLHSRHKIQQMREKGLWPQPGEPPTLEHVKRLAQAGEKIMAVKLYREINGASLMDAKVAVEKLSAA
jgi:hypothetical protein